MGPHGTAAEAATTARDGDGSDADQRRRWAREEEQQKLLLLLLVAVFIVAKFDYG